MRPILRAPLTLAGLVLLLLLVGVQPVSATNSSRLPATDLPPANQAALDKAANQAQRLAGRSYYTEAVVNDTANKVNLYLAHAPQSIVDQLRTMHPGVYVINNDAAHPLSRLLKLEDSLHYASLKSPGGVDILSVRPTRDGHLSVALSSGAAGAQLKLSSSAVRNTEARDRSVLTSILGPGIVRVHWGTAPASATGYRFNDAPNWNAGDFIYHATNGGQPFSTCTSGINVKKASGTTYVISAEHCWDAWGCNNVGVYNGYMEQDYSTIYGNQTKIGNVAYCNGGANTTSTDTSLITTNSGYDMFKGGWNSSTITAVSGEVDNHIGDKNACVSGAFDGNACNLQIYDLNDTVQVCYSTECYWLAHAGSAADPQNSSVVSNGAGDSGGPFFSFNSSGQAQARGMIDAGATQVNCTVNPTGWSNQTITVGGLPHYPRQCYHYVIFEQQGYINSFWNVSPIIK